MEVTSKEGKQKRSSHGALNKAVIVLVVLAICAGFVVGLELLRRRLVALEETVNGLSEICKNDHQASRSNQRNRRDTSSVTLEDVRNEIQKQLRSVTASQLCSPTDTVCLAGPPGTKGDPGIPGVNGRRGKKGNQGEFGPKGDAGFGFGVKGDPGYPGMKGDPGEPGISGPRGMDGFDGIKGDTGYPGPPGSRGPAGYRGPAGVPGAKGKKGDTGDPTMPGSPGPKGTKGSQGFPGKKGFQGELGERGNKGDMGDPTMPGTPGPRGPKGNMGISGLDGIKGDPGYPGAPGLPGEKGDRGDMGGSPGPRGPKGTAGIPGLDGVDGLDGIKGDRGFPGLKGGPGEKGNKGDMGDPTMPGTPGQRGPKGNMGMSGFDGINGNPGYPGPKGGPGEKGNKGDVGDPTMPGTPGLSGPKGTAGMSGLDGLDGIKGDTGYPGPKGGLGEKGNKGDMGGTPGPRGPKGTAGIPGLNGMKGDPGYPGPKGGPGEKGNKGDMDVLACNGPGIPGPKGDPGYPGPKGDPGYPGPKGEPGKPGNKGDPGVAVSSSKEPHGKAPTINVYPSTITVVENSPVKFICYATGQPAPTVRWERLGRGEVLSEDPPGSGVVKITKAQSWHSGKYTCRAFNSLGMKDATVELRVLGKPWIREMFFSSLSRKVIVNAYEDVRIFCHASGIPAPDVEWVKADYTDMPEGRTEIRNDSLVIRKIRVEESAVYICRAQNYYGSVEMRYTVSVTPRGGRGRRDAARNCKELKAQIPSTSSGRYWIDPDVGSTDNGFAYQAYCDQETDGGGWTLVWSFGYQSFKESYQFFDRYMTPRPSIPTSSSDKYHEMSPLSTTIPSDTSTLGAMNFSLWKALGSEVLLQSNQINWYVCKDGSGSIVNWADGSISCHVVKKVVDRCSNKAPSYFVTDLRYGMSLTAGSSYSSYSTFYKVAVMEWSSPKSGGRRLDACGGSYEYIRASSLKDDPRGAWFIR